MQIGELADLKILWKFLVVENMDIKHFALNKSVRFAAASR